MDNPFAYASGDDLKKRWALLQMQAGGDSSPARSWAQALARAAQGGLGGYFAGVAERDEQTANQKLAEALLGPMSSPAPAAAPAPTPMAPRPAAMSAKPMGNVNIPATSVSAAYNRPEVMPSAKVWGDKEAEAAGLYEPAPVKTAALGGGMPTAPAPAPQAPQVAQAAPPSAGLAPIPPEQLAMLRALMTSPNSEYRKMGLAAALKARSELNDTSQVDLGNAVGFVNKRGELLRTLPKGEPNKGPEFGVIAKDDFGKETYGWRNPRDMSVTPANVPGQPLQSTPPVVMGPDNKPIPIPQGQDPKVYREAASKAGAENALPADDTKTLKLRQEIQGLPSYKNIAQSAPVYNSMLKAAGRDNRAADVNLVYGLAKIMDPGSVVREGEIGIAQAIATLPQQLQAQVSSQLTGSGRLTPELRTAILEEAHSRVEAYHGMFAQDMTMYNTIAKDQRMNPAHVIPTFGPYPKYEPTKTTGATPAAKVDDLLKKYGPR